jgi:hypothetical protein
MKLEVVAQQQFEDEAVPQHGVIVPGIGLVELVLDTTTWLYHLIVVNDAQVKRIALDHVGKSEHRRSPVLFGIDDRFGIITSRDELYMYSDVDAPPQRLTIKNRKLLGRSLPADAELLAPSSPISDGLTLPVCFEMDGHLRSPRHWAFLELDPRLRRAEWKSWTSLNTKGLDHHRHASPPKVDGIMMLAGALFVFTSGGRQTAVAKWGMDYFGLVQATPAGDVSRVLMASGDLESSNKKRGVNGLFTSSRDYAVLTPLFSSDEWRGRQKLYALNTGDLIDVTLPRGIDKQSRIIQHGNGLFWLCRWLNQANARSEARWTITMCRATSP